MHDPFEPVEPLAPLDEWAVFTTTLQRSMMWDLVGPHKMKDNPTDFGQTSASMDVLQAEHKEMIERRSYLASLGAHYPLMCYIAAESASQALMQLDKKYENMQDEERMQFRMHNVNIGAAIVGSVLGHLFQNGLIHLGDHQ